MNPYLWTLLMTLLFGAFIYGMWISDQDNKNWIENEEKAHKLAMSQIHLVNRKTET